MEKLEQVKVYVAALNETAGLEQEFIDDFVTKLENDPEVLGEFCAYAETNQFVGKVKVQGYQVVDVLVWQIDHFRAWLDRDTTQTKHNGSAMVLKAFDTFLNMRRNPEKYIRAMGIETGTDYPEKY